MTNQLDYIARNLTRLPSYELDGLEKKLKIEEISEATGVHLDGGGEIDIMGGIIVDPYNPQAAIENIRARAIRVCGSWEAFQAWSSIGGVVRSYYLREKGKNWTMAQEYGTDSLVHFLRYVTLGEIPEWAESRKLREEHMPHIKWSCAPVTGTWHHFPEGFGAKFYQNGRLDLKFKTSEDEERARALIARWTELRSVSAWRNV